MATTTVSDAVVAPQDPGTGLGGNTQANSAMLEALQADRPADDEYVRSGMEFQNHDAANDTVEVAPGVCYIRDDSTSTGGQRGAGGNPQVQSTTGSGYDTELPQDPFYVVIFPTAVTISLTDSTLNQVWINITDVTADNAVEVRSDGGGGTTTQPSDTFLKIGEANPDDATADTRAADQPSVTVRELVDGAGVSHTGELEDDTHATEHHDGGADEIDAANLAGGLGTSGQFLTTDGAAASWGDATTPGNYSDALSNGEALADDGNLYSSVQTAENNATDFVFVGPGTFNEAITIDTAGLTVVGTGRGTLINGGTTGAAITVSAANVSITRLAARADTGSGNVAVGTATGCDALACERVTVLDGSKAFEILDGNDAAIHRCVVEGCDFSAVSMGVRGSVVDCRLKSGIGGDGVNATTASVIVQDNVIIGTGNDGVDMAGDEQIVDGNIIFDVANNGISGPSSDSIATDNRVDNAGANGIQVSGTDQIIANNRISGSTDTNLDTTGATTPTTDANLTGAKN